MFHYTLEPLLRYRKSLEEKQQRALASASRAYNEKQGVVQRLVDGLKTSQKNLVKHSGEITNPSILKLYYTFFAGSRMLIEDKRYIASAAEQIVGIERETLVERVKNRKTIELHKERAQKRYRDIESRKEQAIFDEIALSRYILNKTKDETE